MGHPVDDIKYLLPFNSDFDEVFLKFFSFTFFESLFCSGELMVGLDRVFWRFADFLGLDDFWGLVDLGERDGLGEGEAILEEFKDAKSLLSSLNC